MKVMIDPGHAPGNVNKGPTGYFEYDGMWKLSVYLKTALNRCGIEAFFTRAVDKDKSLTDRGNLAKGYDLFISEHSNSYRGDTRGCECFYSLKRVKDKEYAEQMSNDISLLMENNNRGAKTKLSVNGDDYYAVIRTAAETDCKHIFIVESGFHDNPIDEAFLKINANLEKIAEIQAKNICKILNVVYKDKNYIKIIDEKDLHKIMGKAVISKDKFISWWKKQGITGKLNCSFIDLVNLYYEIAEIEGVRADYALCQALHETGRFQFGGLVLSSQNNYAGLGATDSTAIGGANSFSSPRDGVTAQIQHLKGYASADKLKLACKDLRYKFINPLGSCPYLEWLSIPNNPNKNGWASDKDYFSKIMKIYSSVDSVVVETTKTDVEILLDNMRNIIEFDYLYWKKVLEGVEVVNIEWLKLLLKRLV